jgi:excisionase family DNA binding protein
MSALKHHTVNDVAEMLSVSHKTIRKLIKQGGLMAVKVAGAIRVSDVALAEFLQRQEMSKPVVSQHPPAPKRARKSVTGKNHFA